jgi:hypothetical protein
MERRIRAAIRNSLGMGIVWILGVETNREEALKAIMGIEEQSIPGFF